MIDFILGSAFLTCSIACAKHTLKRDFQKRTDKPRVDIMDWCILDKFKAF